MPSGAEDRVQRILREYQELGDYHGLNSWNDIEGSNVWIETEVNVPKVQMDEPSDMTLFFRKWAWSCWSQQILPGTWQTDLKYYLKSNWAISGFFPGIFQEAAVQQIFFINGRVVRVGYIIIGVIVLWLYNIFFNEKFKL